MYCKIDCENMIIIYGLFGCYFFLVKVGVVCVFVFIKIVVDMVGVGDVFLMIMVFLVVVGGNIEDVVFIGNVVGVIKVGIVGYCNFVEKVLLVKFVIVLLK